MSRASWAALVALALPACATTSQATISHPAGQAAQPSSWQAAQTNVDYVQHNGARGQAAQPYAWVGSQPAYPRDQHRLAQDGQTYAGGRAGQPNSWTPDKIDTWAVQIAANDGTRARQ